MPSWEEITEGYTLPPTEATPTLEVALGELRLGGRTAMPLFESSPLKVALGLTVLPHLGGLPPTLTAELGGENYFPLKYAQEAVGVGADFLFVPLSFEIEEGENLSANEVEGAVGLLSELAQLTDLPLIVELSAEKRLLDNLLNAVAGALRGGKDWLGRAEEDTYRTYAAAAQAYDLGVLAQSPMDINLAKQLNILLHSNGIHYERIIHDPLTGGLGYGAQYTFSVIERLRLGALAGDEATSGLILVNSGEAWSGRECYSGQGPLGDPEKRAPLWEAQTAICGIVAGADACALLHPQAFVYVREAVREINAEPEEAV